MAKLTCSYDDSGKPNMLWYQQKDTAMTLIVLSYGAKTDHMYEDEFKDRFELERKHILNGVLKISDLWLPAWTKTKPPDIQEIHTKEQSDVCEIVVVFFNSISFLYEKNSNNKLKNIHIYISSQVTFIYIVLLTIQIVS